MGSVSWNVQTCCSRNLRDLHELSYKSIRLKRYMPRYLSELKVKVAVLVKSIEALRLSSHGVAI